MNKKQYSHINHNYILLFIILFTLNIFAENNDTTSMKEKTKMFPKAQRGYVKYIISVPKTKNDYDHRIEIIIGQYMTVDCNHRIITSNIVEKDLKGWGYTYLVVQSNPNNIPISTKKGCHKLNIKKFIQLQQEPLLRHYNSRLPIVIYVPKHLTVRYRIWNASKKIEKAIFE